jgi:hypothetical protein
LKAEHGLHAGDNDAGFGEELIDLRFEGRGFF